MSKTTNNRGGARPNAGRHPKNNVRRGVSIYLPTEEHWQNLELVAKEEGYDTIGAMINAYALAKSKRNVHL